MTTTVPTLFESIPESLAAGWDPNRPWDLLGDPLDEFLAQLP